MSRKSLYNSKISRKLRIYESFLLQSKEQNDSRSCLFYRQHSSTWAVRFGSDTSRHPFNIQSEPPITSSASYLMDKISACVSHFTSNWCLKNMQHSSLRIKGDVFRIFFSNLSEMNSLRVWEVELLQVSFFFFENVQDIKSFKHNNRGDYSFSQNV